jgi:hypothetical protein
MRMWLETARVVFEQTFDGAKGIVDRDVRIPIGVAAQAAAVHDQRLAGDVDQDFDVVKPLPRATWMQSCDCDVTARDPVVEALEPRCAVADARLDRR